MHGLQYVTDTEGKTIAVQIPLEDWKLIKAELELYDTDEEMAEILADSDLMASIKKGREQAQKKVGIPLSEVEL
jgi:PHD/YefM family antitoxin component YafN of YafNO toxin-antitoxin module